MIHAQLYNSKRFSVTIDVLSIAVPVTYILSGAVLARCIYGAPADNELSFVGGFSVVLSQITFSIAVVFFGLGEELGWRGYMMPRLEKLIGTPASIVVGGVIWGLWHAPLTCSGHNFGVDYKGFPFVGIGLMCVMCILMNCILTFITKKTKSVYPAAILHMVNNNITGLVMMLLVSQSVDNSGKLLVIMFIPMAIISAVMFTLMMKKSK